MCAVTPSYAHTHSTCVCMFVCVYACMYFTASFSTLHHHTLHLHHYHHTPLPQPKHTTTSPHHYHHIPLPPQSPPPLHTTTTLHPPPPPLHLHWCDALLHSSENLICALLQSSVRLPSCALILALALYIYIFLSKLVYGKGKVWLQRARVCVYVCALV